MDKLDTMVAGHIEERLLDSERLEKLLGSSNSHWPFRTLYSMGFREPGFVNFSVPAEGNRPESP